MMLLVRISLDTYKTCDYIWLNAYHCVLTSSRVRVRVRFSVWLVSGYAHVFIYYFLLSTYRTPSTEAEAQRSREA